MFIESESTKKMAAQMVDHLSNTQIQDMVNYLLSKNNLELKKVPFVTPESIMIENQHYEFSVTREEVKEASFMSTDSEEDIKIPSTPPPFISL